MGTLLERSVGEGPSLEKHIEEAFLLSFEGLRCLYLLEERRLEDEGLATGEKLTVKAYEAERKPVKDRKTW